jgi:hypothetical protein
MTNIFQGQWKRYSIVYWKRIFDIIDNKDLFDRESIFAWGWITYEEYQSSKLYINNPIQVNNKELRVYYYVRNADEGTKLFCFVNTIEFKNRIMNAQNLKDDYLFLQRIYEKDISIYHIFNHEYSRNCWDAINRFE